MSRTLTKDRLHYLFGRLNDKLAARDEQGEVYIVGGAMMVWAHESKRATEDVDGHIRRGRIAVNRAVREIGREEDLSDYWLNEAVTMRHLPEDPDRRERQVYTNTHLTIAGASVERMIAMKLQSGREIDLEDLDVLLKGAEKKSEEEARRIHGWTYGSRKMPDESRVYLQRKYSTGKPGRTRGRHRSGRGSTSEVPKKAADLATTDE